MGLDLRFSCDGCDEISYPVEAVTKWNTATTSFLGYKGSWSSHQVVNLPRGWGSIGGETYCPECIGTKDDWQVCN